jgi:hypothetical protein
VGAETLVVEIGAADGKPAPPSPAIAAASQHLVRAAALSVKASEPQAVLHRYRAFALALDLLAGAVAAGCATLLRFGPEPDVTYVALSVLAPLLWVLVIASRRGYENRFLGAGPEEYRSLGDAALVLFIVIAVASFTVKSDLSRGFIVGFIPLAFVLTLLSRRRLRSWLYRRRLAGDGMHRVLVVGRADAVGHLVEQFEREPWQGLAATGVCVSGGSPVAVRDAVASFAGTDPRTVPTRTCRVTRCAGSPGRWTSVAST